MKTIALMMILTLAAWSNDVAFKPGEWSITTTVEMPGMSMPPMTFNQCLKKDNYIPAQNPQQQEGCKVIESTFDGSTARWKMECEGVETVGSMTFSTESFSGQSSMKMNMNGTTMTTKSTMKGRYVGPCSR
jgi:hypothetical protein